jgi:hypothetical protein
VSGGLRFAHPPYSLAEIEYRAESAEGILRHPFFKGHPGRFVTQDD